MRKNEKYLLNLILSVSLGMGNTVALAKVDNTKQTTKSRAATNQVDLKNEALEWKANREAQFRQVSNLAILKLKRHKTLGSFLKSILTDQVRAEDRDFLFAKAKDLENTKYKVTDLLDGRIAVEINGQVTTFKMELSDNGIKLNINNKSIHYAPDVSIEKLWNSNVVSTRESASFLLDLLFPKAHALIDAALTAGAFLVLFGIGAVANVKYTCGTYDEFLKTCLNESPSETFLLNMARFQADRTNFNIACMRTGKKLRQCVKSKVQVYEEIPATESEPATRRVRIPAELYGYFGVTPEAKRGAAGQQEAEK